MDVWDENGKVHLVALRQLKAARGAHLNHDLKTEA